MNYWPDDDVILYDGVCIFCSRWVRFVATRDTASRFRFTAIQSSYGTRLAQAFGIDADDPDTNAVVHGGVAYYKSDAALTVLSHLPRWRWTRALFRCQGRCGMRSTIWWRATATEFSENLMRALSQMRTCARGCWNNLTASGCRAAVTPQIKVDAA